MRWARLIGKPELVDDPRFDEDSKRGEHGELLSTWMGEWCAQRTREQALALLEQARILPGRSCRRAKCSKTRAFLPPNPSADGRRAH